MEGMNARDLTLFMGIVGEENMVLLSELQQCHDQYSMSMALKAPDPHWKELTKRELFSLSVKYGLACSLEEQS
jgi:hypothetical protein